MRNIQICDGCREMDHEDQPEAAKLKEYLSAIVIEIGSLDYCLRTSRLSYLRHSPGNYITETIAYAHCAAHTNTLLLTKQIYEGIAIATDMAEFAQDHGMTLPHWIFFGKRQEDVATIADTTTRPPQQPELFQNKQTLFLSILATAVIYNKARYLKKHNFEIAGFLSKGLFYLHNPFTSQAQFNNLLYESISYLRLALSILNDMTKRTGENRKGNPFAQISVTQQTYISH